MTSVQSNEVKATKATPTKDVNAEEVKDESNKEEEKPKEDSRKYTVVITASGMKKVSDDETKKDDVAEEVKDE